VLQCVAVCCRVLPCVAVHSKGSHVQLHESLLGSHWVSNSSTKKIVEQMSTSAPSSWYKSKKKDDLVPSEWYKSNQRRELM